METTFRTIYSTAAWGEGSGPGSRPETTAEYRRIVEDILSRCAVRSVVDLGCGRWGFSQLIDWKGAEYLGLDVVPEVIEANARPFQSERVRFQVADFAVADLPRADLALLKDTLQHWTNDGVFAFLPKLARFRFSLITNDVGVRRGTTLNTAGLNGSFAGDIRCRWRPIDLTRPPFSMPAIEVKKYEVLGFVKKVCLFRAEDIRARFGLREATCPAEAR